MRLYAIYRPSFARSSGVGAEGPIDATLARDLVLVREGFDWLAFFFAPFHAIGCGAWTAALGTLALLAVTIGVPELLDLDPLARVLAVLGGQILCGVSAHDVRRLSLEARGFTLIDVIAGADRAHALIRLAERQVSPPSVPPEAPHVPTRRSPPFDLGPSPGFWS
ncbi:MAG: DUF2628 domain-containing protein [Alphaproteobacteria bacterium]|nr:DUF2628 domain-containing protein [Alphaproteobacteria bacterium]